MISYLYGSIVSVEGINVSIVTKGGVGYLLCVGSRSASAVRVGVEYGFYVESVIRENSFSPLCI